MLELDGGQQRAWINWGRVICLRADEARAAGDTPGAAKLFGLAAEKFDAALDIEPQVRGMGPRVGGGARPSCSGWRLRSLMPHSTSARR